MDDNNASHGFSFVLIVALIWLCTTVYNQNKQIEKLKSVVQDCDSAVIKANSNIEDSNNEILNAKDQAWSDYDTMGQTLEGLSDAEQVENPCYIPTE